MRTLVCAIILSLVFQVAAFAGGKKSANRCATKYPVILAHGMGAQYEIAWGITHYWNRIPDELRDEGAEIYITSVNAMDGTISKGEEWRRQVLEILAVSGAQKVNIIGHSHGSIYSRYAITNLPDLANRIASHTSIAGPHRGSSMAELVLGIISGNIGEDIVNAVFGILMGDNNPDTVQNLEDLTRDFMVNVFNPNTPDLPGLYYQSYAYKIRTMIGSGIFLLTWPIQYLFEGANDGLVAVTSAQWGNFRGVEGGAWWAGVSQLAAVDMLFGITPGFNAPAHFIDIVEDLKNRGF